MYKQYHFVCCSLITVVLKNLSHHCKFSAATLSLLMPSVFPALLPFSSSFPYSSSLSTFSVLVLTVSFPPLSSPKNAPATGMCSECGTVKCLHIDEHNSTGSVLLITVLQLCYWSDLTILQTLLKKKRLLLHGLVGQQTYWDSILAAITGMLSLSPSAPNSPATQNVTPAHSSYQGCRCTNHCLPWK